MIGRINKNNLLKIEELKVIKLKKKLRAIFISFLPMELFLFSASLGNSDNVLVRRDDNFFMLWIQYNLSYSNLKGDDDFIRITERL